MVWLGMATILVSLGNFIAHTFLFNIKGGTLYNAGMATACFLFAPCVFYFFYIGYQFHLIPSIDYLTGIPLGIVLNVVGILKMIDWLKNKNSPYCFEQWNLLWDDKTWNRGGVDFPLVKFILIKLKGNILKSFSNFRVFMTIILKSGNLLWYTS